MSSATCFFELFILALALIAITYCGISIVAAGDFFAGKKNSIPDSPDLPPASILVPIAAAEPGAYETYRSFCLQNYPEYQVLFSANSDKDSAVAVVKKLMRDLKTDNVDIVISGEVIGLNAKVSNLENALLRSKYDRIVMLDSDIRIRSDYLRNILPLLSDSSIGLVTCLYRSAGAADFASKLEAISLTTEFAPGVLVARFLQGVKFALGSTMAISKTKLESIGGFRAVADYLADDYMLGNLVAATGSRVEISKYIVETLVAPSGFFEMVKHQLRWARSTRFSRPLGYFGLALTHCIPLTILYSICTHGAMKSLSLLGLAIALKMIASWWIGVHWLKDKVLRKHFWLVPIIDIFSFLIWCLGMTGRRVEWRGQALRINHGKIVDSTATQQYDVNMGRELAAGARASRPQN